MKKTIVILTLSLITSNMFAQEITKSDSQWEKYVEELNGQEEFESVDWDAYYDHLADLHEHPININTIQKEDLEQMPFLSAQQIEDILAYLYQYGEMKSLGELAMIRSLDYCQCQLLRCFTFAGETQQKSTYPSLKEILKYGKQEIVATGKIPFYSRKGDTNGYLGDKYKHWIKYSFSEGQYFKTGILGSQDAGEPFLQDRNRLGYDYYTFWIQIRKMGCLKNFVLGRYRLNFGMGLAINNDFGLGKIATLATLGRTTTNIRAHSSRYAGNYLQGVAATISLNKHIDLSTFISYRKIDATLNKDSSQSIATIITTGYHRTQTEMDKKDNTSSFLSGGHINGFWNGFHAGITGFYTTFNKEMKPKTSQIYRRWYASGKDFYNLSLDYGYTSHRLNISGETATGDCHAIATINTISYLLTNDFSLIALQRYYSYRYHSFYSNSFSECGNIQDENGIYIGTSWNPSQKFSVMAYTDYAYFSWPKYEHTKSSKDLDNLISTTWLPCQWHFLFRYRLRLKDIENHIDGITAISCKSEQRGRMTVNYEGTTYCYKTQADVCYSKLKGKSFGWMISENVTGKWSVLRCSVTASYFHTKDYNSRLYVYEQGVLYNMSFPMFYGEGIHYAFNIRTDFNKNLMILAKIGTTDYFDRNHISSSYQQINHSSMTDLDIQIRYKF